MNNEERKPREMELANRAQAGEKLASIIRAKRMKAADDAASDGHRKPIRISPSLPAVGEDTCKTSAGQTILAQLRASAEERQEVRVDGLNASITADAIEQTQLFKFHTRGGTGFAAEDANARADRLAGKTVEEIGRTNEANGADRIANGVPIQTKYFDTASRTLNAAFDENTGLYRYKGQLLEVPSDQHAKCVELMKEKIAAGKVEGVTDPEQAENIVKKGSVTYQQARNIARPGNTTASSTTPSSRPWGAPTPSACPSSSPMRARVGRACRAAKQSRSRSRAACSPGHPASSRASSRASCSAPGQPRWACPWPGTGCAGCTTLATWARPSWRSWRNTRWASRFTEPLP